MALPFVTARMAVDGTALDAGDYAVLAVIEPSPVEPVCEACVGHLHEGPCQECIASKCGVMVIASPPAV